MAALSLGDVIKTKDYSMGSRNINSDLRETLKRQVDGICSICLKRPYDLDAHRIVPGREGGKYAEDNIVMVCPECHRIIDKQVGLRRVLLNLRETLEWIISQHRLPGDKIKIKNIRERWECRRIKSSKDPLLKDTLELFDAFKDDENEDLTKILIWLDDMITWRRVCTRLLNMCLDNKATYSTIATKLRNVLDLNEDDPRYLDINNKLIEITDKKELYTFIKNEILRLEDYLVVHRDGDEIIGFIYFHYYYKHRYAFVSYVVLAKSKKGGGRRPYQLHSLDKLAINGLISNLIRNHPECEGVIMEVDPDSKETLKHVSDDLKYTTKNRGRGLYRLFNMHFSELKRIDISYIQPKSFVHSERDEKNLWLLFYPFSRKGNKASKFINKKTLEKILDCVYCYVYSDELDNLKDFNADKYTSYVNYLETMKKIILGSALEKIKLV